MSDFLEWAYENRRQIGLDILAGSFSGMCNILSSHPMDTIKVRMQMSHDGIIKTITSIMKNEGIFSFYKGMLFPFISVPILQATVFSNHEFWKRFFVGDSKQSLTCYQNMIAGGLSGLAASFISCPVELAKCRLQMQVQNVNKMWKNPVDCMIQIARKEGISYLYRGMNVTCQREILGYAALFVVYDVVKDALISVKKQKEASNLDMLISGGLGGIACWTIGYPQDIIKTILQCDTGIGKTRKYKPHFLDGGFYSCLVEQVGKNGWRCLFKGYSVCIFRAFYANAIGFYAFETAKKYLNR
ncbi:unnamed protein product (macronuclear) [Paramecium tetraurelia]|uniref:Mitochondrial carrier protein n=1 Tax=Paramecium tetraurelia TaxID=5888 RepID=A0BAW2_PARTE|nr:uncharacterized protein GSPATT00000114001 [Paramecium tetraurelia]CAK55679.1 unnamed protein product [Paramecium tetraurelia]|eukprot:XP_001423077.1 hypothetical protein (macronuclear) [Paramecium tetraurelia strain d4-2]